MRVIALEEHFATPGLLDGPGRKLKERAEQSGGRLATLVAQLIDVGDRRIAAMDAAGVDVQALSLTAPGVEQLEVEEAKTLARETNAALAEAVRRHPSRSSGLRRCQSAILRRRLRSSSARRAMADREARSSGRTSFCRRN
jgi:predicted TIM-barrel fold metal-dependent hydrolase